MWRKTRSDHGSALCPGADPNRNFGVDWSGGPHVCFLSHNSELKDISIVTCPLIRGDFG